MAANSLHIGFVVTQYVLYIFLPILDCVDLNCTLAVIPPGTTCDCGRYRKVVGQLDVSIGKLSNAVKFVKNGKWQRYCGVHAWCNTHHSRRQVSILSVTV